MSTFFEEITKIPYIGFVTGIGWSKENTVSGGDVWSIYSQKNIETFAIPAVIGHTRIKIWYAIEKPALININTGIFDEVYSHAIYRGKKT
jgi:hypothetical protein